jgi:peptide/nickel transport system substrate-binding protein
MRSLRYFLRLSFAFLGKFKGLIFLSSILGISLFLILWFLIPSITLGKKEIIGVYGRFQIDTLPIDITNLISRGLTKIDATGLPQPNLATSWNTPDKGKTWVFHLRKDILWHDNKKLISSDINYNFYDVKIEHPDDTTIVFNLKEPYIPFPTIVSKPIFKKGLLGTGDWKVSKISVIGEYIQKLILKKGREEIIYKFYPTEEQQIFAYKMGEVNSIINLSNASPFDKWNNSSISEIFNYNQTTVIFFNTQDSLLAEKNIRQALSYAINKDTLGKERSISPISSSSYAFNPQVKNYNYDPVRAKEIIDALPKEAKTILKIKLVSTPALLSTAEKVADDWRAVGIDTNVLVTSVVPSDYQAYLTIFDIPSDPDQYFLWHSTQTDTNITKYKNPRIDKLLEDGRLEQNFEDRKNIYLDFQRFLMEDSPAVFLYYPVWYDIARK